MNENLLPLIEDSEAYKVEFTTVDSAQAVALTGLLHTILGKNQTVSVEPNPSEQYTPTEPFVILAENLSKSTALTLMRWFSPDKPYIKNVVSRLKLQPLEPNPEHLQTK